MNKAPDTISFLKNVLRNTTDEPSKRAIKTLIKVVKRKILRKKKNDTSIQH